MGIWEKCAYLLANGKDRQDIRRQSDQLTNPKFELQARGHYELALIFRSEANRLPLLAPLYRHREKFHIAEGAAKAQIFPGPLGLKAVDEITEGDFEEGIKHLDEEIERLTRWLEIPEVAREDDRVRKFEYLKIGGTALSQIGQFTESREWFDRALAAFGDLDAESRTQLAEAPNQIVLGIAWTLQLDMKFQEALKVITDQLNKFTFSSFPTKSRELLKSGQAVLTAFLPQISAFQQSVHAGTLLQELIAKIQRCDTAEAIRKTRKEIINELKAKAYGLGIEAVAAAAVADIQNQMSVIRQLLSRPAPRPTMSLRLDEINSVTKQLTDRLLDFSVRMNEVSIAKVRTIVLDVYRIPVSNRLKWLWLMALRVGLQLIAITYFIEQVVESLLHAYGKEAAAALRLVVNEHGYKIAVAVVIFIIGKLVEKEIDRRFLLKFKRTLILLVIDRSRSMWIAFNSILLMSQTALAGLAPLQTQANSLFKTELEEDEDSDFEDT